MFEELERYVADRYFVAWQSDDNEQLKDSTTWVWRVLRVSWRSDMCLLSVSNCSINDCQYHCYVSSPLPSAEALCLEVEQRSGLSSWGDKRFVEPLQIYLDSLACSAQLHERGWRATTANTSRLLNNRLLIQRELERNAAITQRPILAPLFVVGMPRTGSTMLQNLLACDPAARSLNYYEANIPVWGETIASDVEDPRIRVAALQLRVLNRAAPGLNKIHAMYPTAPEECSRLMEHSFVDTLFEMSSWVPDYSDWLRTNESQRFYYEELRVMLQLLGMVDFQTHWVCKAPRHLPNLGPLVDVFPDAKLVWTHRDPVSVVPSVASLAAAASSVASDHVSKEKLGSFWLRRISEGLRKGLAHRETDDANRYVDVEYEDLVADPIATVRQIYATHGYAYSDAFESAMLSWLAQNPKGRHGRHSYSPVEYGLTAAEIRAGFL